MINFDKQIVFLGKPGAGKGTVANEIAKEYGLIHVSTGNIFREEIASKSKLGLKVIKIVESGQYVPDDITNEIVKNKLDKLISEKKIFMLDGFPRTEEQAKFLDTIKNLNYNVIMLDVSQEIIVKRLSGRRQCSKCQANYHIDFKPSKVKDVCDLCQGELIKRKDDSEESIKTRLQIYDEQTKPVIDYYQQKNNLFVIDGTKEPKEIASLIINKLYNK
ncbi:adenylate kinase family protein [Mycoplasmopsis hyopharyngis]|uniref:adenylate kinase family protein n=1 Tax=Mycoplasmopsis hyopharyngis TaxID=29558 RepID=UPI0038739D8F